MPGYKRTGKDTARTVDLNRDRYRQLVAGRGWDTQTKQALALGVRQGTISRIVEGGRRPGPNVIAALMAAFPRERFHRLFTIVEIADEDTSLEKAS